MSEYDNPLPAGMVGIIVWAVFYIVSIAIYAPPLPKKNMVVNRRPLVRQFTCDIVAGTGTYQEFRYGATSGAILISAERFNAVCMGSE